jgi:hypothetical protein
MSSPLLRISFSGGSDTKLTDALKKIGPKIVSVLTVKVSALMLQLSSYVVARKLSGNPLHRRTGILAGSVTTVPTTVSGGVIRGAVESSGGPAFYGAIHEHGGSRAYQIVATKARALRFVMNGKTVFAKSVIHPPAKVRAFMLPSLTENAANIEAQLRATIEKEIQKL